MAKIRRRLSRSCGARSLFLTEFPEEDEIQEVVSEKEFAPVPIQQVDGAI
ncbi:uncharacterized protein [Zea mays]|nr:uncharacterized protein LOC109940957 [Zea mays]|eukprot:XP_020396952.1 uncharacterized protein LOC109940957 [Zea mays]